MRLAPQHALIFPGAVTIAGLLALGATAIGGWPGVVGSSGMTFCEHGSGIIRQPVNTWSNLGYVVAGLIVGWWTVHRFRPGTQVFAGNRMHQILFFPVLYATVAAAIGPASMALHASTTTWGGQVDILSMFLWAAFVLAYGLTRVFDWDERRFVSAHLGVFAVAAFIFLAQPISVSGTVLFGLIVAGFAATEAWIVLRRADLTADRRFLAGTAISFAVAFAIWLPSQTGGPLCAPDSWLQGHAIWHVLTALSVLLLFAYYDSERSVAVGVGSNQALSAGRR